MSLFTDTPLVRAYERIVGLERQLATVTTHAEWLRQRVNGLEMERATLLQRVIGGPVVAPTIHPFVPASELSREQADKAREALLSVESLFEDMGDEKAKEHQIRHDETGRLTS